MESSSWLCFSILHNTKILRRGLSLVWICGAFFIGISFYGTQKLPALLEEQITTKKPGPYSLAFGDLSFPKTTIFTAPKPFVGSTGKAQALAVRSWLGLSKNIEVVLFSQDPSVLSFADLFGSRVSVEANIDFTFLGTPLFHSMVARSRATSSDISVLIDPDTILLSNFLTTLKYAHKLDADWLLVASPRNVSDFPFHLDSYGRNWLASDGKPVGTQKLLEFLAHKPFGDPSQERMLIAWNNGDNMPLHKGVLPPFLYGKGLHNRWILTEALNSEYRFVLDASSTISSFYIVTSEFEKSWENRANSILARLYGSFSFRRANFSTSLFRSFNCGGNFLCINTHLNIVYPLGKITIPLSFKQHNILECVDVLKNSKLLEGFEEFFLEKQTGVQVKISHPFSLEALLLMQADENKTVVLGVAGYSYKDMLMSWVCRLRHLKVFNFLVCALDDEVYEFSVLQGVPVIKCTHHPTSISFDDCHFGTECFQKVTKVKSRVVMQILKLQYNVLLSDMDVYWFKNPLAYLSSFGSGVLVAQSDEYNSTGPINLPRRLNSGFYYARSDDTTIAALGKVVRHAANSNLSEQPSFYDTLCGEDGSHRLGDDRCLEPETGLVVQFLNRNLFPNGAYADLWAKKNTAKACAEMGCLVIHNNWISGRKKKLERQVSSGLWSYDVTTRMCFQPWRKTRAWSYFR